MGFFDEVRNVVDLFIVQPVNIATDFGNDVREIATAMVTGEMSDDFKTSSDMRDEADELIKRMSGKYESKKRQLKKAIQQLNKEVEEFEENQKELSRLASITYQTAYRYEGKSRSGNIIEPQYKKVVELMNFEHDILQDMLIMKAQRNNAREYLEDAKDYKSDVSIQIANMNDSLTKIEIMKDRISEANLLICSIIQRFEEGVISAKNKKVCEQIAYLVTNEVYHPKRFRINDLYISTLETCYEIIVD